MLTFLDGLAVWQLAAIFAVSAVLVVAAGIALARSGDIIASRTGLGGLFVGMLLLAAATSLPEIVTDVSAALDDAPDLALGDLFGSSMANMAILALVDLLHRGQVWPATGLGHARLAAIAIGLTAVVLLGIAAPSGIRIGWVGIEPVIVVAAYVFAAAWVHRSRDPEPAGIPGEPAGDLLEPIGDLLEPIGLEDTDGERPSLRRGLAVFGIASMFILLAAPVMAESAHGIATATGVAETFVGATMLALATSLPELATSVAAVRIGAYDLAVGNLFGSNALNATIVFFADAAYTGGPILSAVSPQEIVAGLGAVLLLAIALGGIVHGARVRIERGEPDAILLLVAYAVILWLLWAGS